jgi:plasmid maintenance system antidote protein VapI
VNAAELKESLRLLGWSQNRLAGVVGMHPNSISKMVSADKISKPVAAYLDVQVKLKEMVK